MYGGPLLRGDRPSNLRFNNLLNLLMFEGHQKFLTDYILMHDSKSLWQIFEHVRVQPSFQSRSCHEIGTWYLLTPPLSSPSVEWQPGSCSIEFTGFLRTVVRMYEVRYPTHWLAGILTGICEGSITTTARSPWKLVLHPDDLKKYCSHNGKALLGHGELGLLRCPVSVLEWSITFPKFLEKDIRVPHSNLVFINSSMDGPRKPILLSLLQDDEERDASNYAKFCDRRVCTCSQPSSM
ncbi:tetratricopeptide-like protein [Colletotrichum tofieldiae]|uniref:Tetratricopeptide-like protein n=1 Tax=Colletotrichum tofieldiae TaxID=708197 RepID=A0A166ME32_9PEZI|nr:tetratricopeptide-like protein [Colletotrichum tofieldiae]